MSDGTVPARSPEAADGAGGAWPSLPGRPGPSAIELVGISTSFGPVQANKDIDLQVRRGTIHGIVGENGAGKSTLMSILYGFYNADAGEIRIDGKPTAIPDSQAAIRAGHRHGPSALHAGGAVHRARERDARRRGRRAAQRPSLAKARAELKRLEEEYELEVDPDAVVGELSVGLQQRVEILKALYRECDILILDEPTGVLTPAEADHLFRILQHLKAEGKTIILITHKLREIMAVTDEVSVMRRGEMVRTLVTAETSPAELAELMVGRRVLLRVEKAPAKPGRWCSRSTTWRSSTPRGCARLKSVSFAVRAGEILGVAGCRGQRPVGAPGGAGGIRPATGGTVRYKGQPLPLTPSTNADDRRDARIAHVPEDRHRRGLVMPFSAVGELLPRLPARAALRGAGVHARPHRMIRDLARRRSSASTSGRRRATSRPPTSPAATSRRS